MGEIFAFGMTLAVTSGLLLALIPLAKRVGLVDRPSDRKQHIGHVPLVGGLAIMGGAFTGLALIPGAVGADITPLALGVLALLMMGVADDYRHLPAPVRFGLQAAIVFAVSWFSDVRLTNLGDLIGTGDVTLTTMSFPVTVFCVVGAINAINMSDGVDGLAGSLCFVALGGALLASIAGGRADLAVGLGVFVLALIPFLAVNARLFTDRPARAFLGDSGAMTLGLVISWFLIQACQGEGAVLSPVTAMFLFGIPLFDSVAVMLRRALKGRSPFSPDREHFHHIFIAAGLTPRQTLSTVVSMSVIGASQGLAAQWLAVTSATSFLFLTASFAAFYVVLMYAWRATRVLRRALTRHTPSLPRTSGRRFDINGGRDAA